MRRSISVYLFAALLLLFPAFAQPFPPCPTFSYILPITNPSTTTHLYTLTFSDYATYAQINPTPLILSPQSAENITLTFSPPCDATFTYNTTLLISEADTLISSVPFSFPVQGIAQATITLGKGVYLPNDPYTHFAEGIQTYTYCNGSAYAIPFTITHTGVNETYRFSVPQVPGIKIAATQYALVHEQKGINAIILNGAIPEGLFLRILAQNSKASQLIPLNISTSNCLSASASAALPTCGCTPAKHNLLLTSDLQENISVTLYSSTSTLDFPNQIIVQGRTIIPITYTPTTCTDQTYSEQLTVVGPAGNQTVTLVGEVESAETCLKTTLSHQRAVYLPLNQEKPFQITVQNFAEDTQTYAFSLDAPTWITLEEGQATIRAGQSYSVPLLVAPINVSEGWHYATFTAVHNNITESSEFAVYVSGKTTQYTLWAILSVIIILVIITAIWYYKKKTPKKVIIERRILTTKKEIKKIQKELPKVQIKTIEIQWQILYWILLAAVLVFYFVNIYWATVATLLVLGWGSLLKNKHPYFLVSGIIFMLSALILILAQLVPKVSFFLANYGLSLWLGLGGLFVLVSLAQLAPKVKQFLLAEDLEVAQQRKEEEKMLEKKNSKYK